MPTDQSHIIAFLGTLSGIGLLGVVAFAYIWRTTKPRTEQKMFEFPPRAPKPAARETPTRPMAPV